MTEILALTAARDLLMTIAARLELPRSAESGPTDDPALYERAIDGLETDLRDAEESARQWKAQADMYADAWLRELGGRAIRKTHLIDALVLTTRQMRARLALFEAAPENIYLATYWRATEAPIEGARG